MQPTSGPARALAVTRSARPLRATRTPAEEVRADEIRAAGKRAAGIGVPRGTEGED